MPEELKFEFRSHGNGRAKGTLTAEMNGRVLVAAVMDTRNEKPRTAFLKKVLKQCPQAGLFEHLEVELLAVLKEQVEDLDRRQVAEDAGEGRDDQTPEGVEKNALEDAPPEIVKAAGELLASPRLIEQLGEHVHVLGIAGERTLSLAVYLIGTSRLLPRPLAGTVMGASSAGKSYIIDRVASLFPPEAVLRAHRLSPRALERLPDQALVHRFVVTGERSRKGGDGAAEGTRALREMLGDGRLTVIRRLDACLESTKQDVLKMSEQLDKAGVANKVGALSKAAGPDANHAFYNDSPFTLRDLQSRGKEQQLKADFEAYLDGFSPNVQEILEKFKFRNQIPTLVDADALGPLIEKFLNPDINLSPHPVRDAEGNVRPPGPAASSASRSTSGPPTSCWPN